MYEVIPTFRRRRIGLDIEWLRSEHPELEVEPTLRALSDAVEALHGTGPLRVATLSACREDKVSFHVLFVDTCMGFLEQRAFVALLEARVAPLGFPVGVPDFSIYTPNRAMRMLNQTKVGGNRPLVPYGEGASTDAFDYMWSHYGALEDLPAVTWKDPSPPPPPVHVVIERPTVEDTPERRALIAECASMLSAARADHEPMWASVGWALKNIGDDMGDTDAFKVNFIAFSRLSRKFNLVECERKWDRARIGTLNIGSLRRWAEEDDPVRFAVVKRAFGRTWHAAREAEEAEEAEDVDIAAAFAGLRVGPRVDGPAELPPAPVMEGPGPRVPIIEAPIDRRVSTFVVPTGRPTDTYETVKVEFEKSRVVVNNPFHFMRINADGSFQRMAKATMVDMHQNIKLYKEPGAKLPTNFMGKWLTDPTRRTLEKVDFYPPPLVVPDNCYNTFTGFKAATHAPVEGVDFSPILHHMDVLCGHAPGGHGREYMLDSDWLAFLVQRLR